MAQQSAHYDIYRQELGRAYPGFGYALWVPSPGEQNTPVEVGDVGFIRQGQFHRLFNALLPANHESHENYRVPEAHEPLRLTVTNHINRTDLTPNTFHSHGVTVKSAGLEVPAGMTIGSQIAEVSFSCTRKLGAAVSLPATVRCEDTLTRGHFRKWIIKHIDSWFAFTELHGLDLEMEDIVFVTGCHRTRSWSNITFTEVQDDARFTLQVEVTGTLGASVNWRASSLCIQGAVYSQGPSGENLPENQCVFIRGYRIKRIFGILPWPKGAAEPKPNPRGDREPEKEVDPIPSVTTKCRDPLHVLLEYIAGQAKDCHLALVHDDDLERVLEVGDGTSLEALRPGEVMDYLQRSKPEIGIMSDAFSTNDTSARPDMAHVRVAMLSEQLHSFGPFDDQTSVTSLSHLSADTTNREQTNQTVPWGQPPQHFSAPAQLSFGPFGQIPATDHQTSVPSLPHFSAGTTNREQTDDCFPLEQLPGHHFPTTSQPALPPQIEISASLLTTTKNRWQCPACPTLFPRRQERDRHLLTHLPDWIHCPLPHCSWRGNRLESFRRHWQQLDHRMYHGDHFPTREQFETYNPQEFVAHINAGTMTASVARGHALERVRARPDQLKMPSMSTNPWGRKLRADSSCEASGSGSLPETDPNSPDMSEHVQDDVNDEHPVIDGAECTGAT